MEILDLLSPIEKSGWMADVLTKHLDGNKSPFARSIVLTALTHLEESDHTRLYNQLLNNFENEK